MTTSDLIKRSAEMITALESAPVHDDDMGLSMTLSDAADTIRELVVALGAAQAKPAETPDNY